MELLVQNLSKQFGDKTVLEDINFSMRSGEFVTFGGCSDRGITFPFCDTTATGALSSVQCMIGTLNKSKRCIGLIGIRIVGGYHTTAKSQSDSGVEVFVLFQLSQNSATESKRTLQRCFR